MPLSEMHILKVVSPLELENILSELFFNGVIRNSTPEGFNNVILDIDVIRNKYAAQDEFELCIICRDKTKDLIERMDEFYAATLVIQATQSLKPFYDEDF